MKKTIFLIYILFSIFNPVYGEDKVATLNLVSQYYADKIPLGNAGMSFFYKGAVSCEKKGVKNNIEATTCLSADHICYTFYDLKTEVYESYCWNVLEMQLFEFNLNQSKANKLQ